MREISIRMSRKAGGGKGVATKSVEARKPDLDRVSGQLAYVGIVCWNCWAVNEVAVSDPTKYIEFVCWNCGGGGAI